MAEQVGYLKENYNITDIETGDCFVLPKKSNDTKQQFLRRFIEIYKKKVRKDSRLERLKYLLQFSDMELALLA